MATGSGHRSAASARCRAIAVVNAASALEKAAPMPSPAVEKT
jgi:hypothetical protein